MWKAVKSGSWASEDRLKGYLCIILCFSAAAAIYMLATYHGLLDAMGRPLGTDFSQVYVAGLEALAGHPETPFDLPRHIAEQQRFFGAQDAVYSWHYPPFFLVLAAALAHLPYLEALLLYQLGTLAMYLVVMLAILRETGMSRVAQMMAALAFPAVLINLGHGQNGFLTAALLGAALLSLDRRPLLAGAAIGLLSFKPQLALVLPVALIAGSYWRVVAAASATVAVMLIISIAEFGVSVWSAFFSSLPVTRQLLMEQGAIIGFEKIQSVFSGVRLMGGGVAEAYAVQGAITLGALTALLSLWRSDADQRLKAATALIAALVATPYCLDYDMVTLGPALAFLVAHGMKRGFLPYEKSIFGLAFIAPMLARPVASVIPVPFGAITMIILFGTALRRAQGDFANERVDTNAAV